MMSAINPDTKVLLVPLDRLRAGMGILMVVICLALAGCAGWQAPAAFDDSSLRARAVSQTERGVELSAAVLSSADSLRMFGVTVNESGVQPVWLEVKNDTDQVLWLLRFGTDPDLFSPLEVAWSFHTSFAGESNSRLDEHFDSMSFQNPIAPGATQSGIIFTNPHDQTRLLNIDVLGQGEVFPFTLFVKVPDHHSDESTASIAKLQELLGVETVDYRGVDEFRARLQKLHCCARGDQESEAGDPLNVILVGEFNDIVSAFVRRGFRLDAREFHRSQRRFGRPPDIVTRKAGQGGVPAIWVRAWVAPFRYQGQPVFVAQVGRRQGWRSAEIEQADVIPSRYFDEVRNSLVQDMAYSGGLQKVGFTGADAVTGAGESPGITGDASYRTDGLLAVLFFITRPLSLSDIEILDWYPLDKLNEATGTVENEDRGS